MVGSKQPQPVFLSPEEAESHCRAGASVWKFASIDEVLDPDVVLVGIGAELTFEVIEAAAILRRVAPSLRVRVINVTDLMILNHEGGTHMHLLTKNLTGCSRQIVPFISITMAMAMSSKVYCSADLICIVSVLKRTQKKAAPQHHWI